MDRMIRPEEHVDKMILGDPECACVVRTVVIYLAASFLLEKLEAAVRTFILEDVLPFSYCFHCAFRLGVRI